MGCFANVAGEEAQAECSSCSNSKQEQTRAFSYQSHPDADLVVRGYTDKYTILVTNMRRCMRMTRPLVVPYAAHRRVIRLCFVNI